MLNSDKYGSIPSDLDDMKPGPELGAVLASVSMNQLSGHDRVVVLRAHQRMASHHQAHVYAAIASVSDALLEDLNDDPQLAWEAASAEVRVALQLTRRAADVDLTLALDLRRRLPRVVGLLESGAIDVRRARLIVHATSHLSITAAQAVADEVLEQAPRLTTGQLMARLRRLCLQVNPEDARGRYQGAVADRRVVSEPTTDGTTHLLGLDLPPDRVAAATRYVTRLAQSLRRNGESRTIDQLRADVLLDLLTGITRASRSDRGMVDIHVDLQTLTELSEQPGELAGYGPVIADIARRVAREQSRAEWRYTITHPDTGQAITTGITRRRPSTAQRRDVQADAPTCVFPGCRMPATECDLDHRTAHSEGGPTITTNLDPLCRHHHRLKGAAGWTYQPLANGTYMWTTRLGHTYISGGAPP